MRFHEIQRRPAAPNSHPYVVDLSIDPAAFDDFERAMQERYDLRLLTKHAQPRAAPT